MDDVSMQHDETSSLASAQDQPAQDAGMNTGNSSADADGIVPHNQEKNRDDSMGKDQAMNSDNDTTDSEDVNAAETSRSTAAAPQTITFADIGPIKPKPKIRIKLKLPTQAKRKLPLSSESRSNDTTKPSEDASASRPMKAFKKSLPLSKHVTGTGSRRRPVAPSKQVKIPPLASPGLLVPGKPSPREVFDAAMAGAGYTTKQRTENPHRGSSVQRTVDDMFDTDVKLALHPIELAPRDLWDGTIKRQGETVKLIDLLARSLEGKSSISRTMPFKDMVPVSLTLSHPKSFTDKRLEYVEKVRQRERLIVEYQEAAEDIEASAEDGVQKNNPIKVPPIPEPPLPPKVEEFGLEKADFSSSTDHPIYLPAKADLVAHLDPHCFHITQGRYFGLSSNKVADPNAHGPNAAGYSGTSGLATATTSTTTSTSGISGGGMALILSAGFHCAAAVPLKESSSFKPHTRTPAAPPAVPSETANSLRLLMMDGNWADQFRLAILKAAAYASRTEVYDTCFTGPNSRVYPDLGKAFSLYAQIKPCARCKSNKQGVYHCRIRRRHKEPDFDGGSTATVLDQYFDVPLESLLVT